MLVLMYNLASTADVYLSPSLEYITLRFGLSESLAGVTLLAFGNGAPDVFSAIAASLSGSDTDISGSESSEAEILSISSLVGSAIFISSIVTALAVSVAKPDKKIKVTPVFFIRDLIFEILCMFYLLLILLVLKKVNIYIAVGFIVIYLVYVVLVVVQSKKPDAEESPEEQKKNMEAAKLIHDLNKEA